MAVWVIHASKYGSTREIADAIADDRRADGNDVEVHAASDVERFDQADAVVLGSAIYAGHWLKQARELVEHRAEWR